MRISCCELYAHLGRYLDWTHAEPVIITRFARVRAVLVSAEAFHERLAEAAADLRQSLQGGAAVSVPVFRKTCVYRQEHEPTAPVFVTAKSGRASVLLSPKAFDALFPGEMERHHAPEAPLRIAAGPFRAKIHQYLRLSCQRPIIITKGNRDLAALLSAFAYRLLRRGSSAGEGDDQPLETLSVSQFEAHASLYLRAVVRPVLITVNGHEQNVLMPPALFARLTAPADAVS